MRRSFVFGCVVSLICGGALVLACVGDSPEASGSNEDASGDATTDGSLNDAGGDVITTLADGAVIGVQQVAAGEEHACALLTDQTVWCWGDNTYGEIGQPITVQGQAAPAKVNGISNVVQISVGTSHSCALEVDGSVWCWGRNNQLNLGASYPTDIASCSGGACNPVPQKVAGIAALQIAVGHNMSCAIAPSGQISCWGANGFGQCGAPPSGGTGGIAPVEIPLSLVHGKRIQFGYFGQTTCAIDSSFQVWCWGANDYGQLGHTPGTSGDKTVSSTFYDEAPHNITLNGDAGGVFGGSVDVLASPTVCVARGGGAVFCWGRDENNSLALGQADGGPHFIPTQISGISGATNVSGGAAMCALLDGGAISCWGGDQVAEANAQGFDGGCLTFGGDPAPCYGVGIVPAPPFSQISIYAQVALGVGLDGGAYGWGHNSNYGRIGHPMATAGDDPNLYNGTPTPIVGLP